MSTASVVIEHIFTSLEDNSEQMNDKPIKTSNKGKLKEKSSNLYENLNEFQDVLQRLTPQSYTMNHITFHLLYV